MNCLECRAELTPSHAGHPKRYCCVEHRKTFENRAAERGKALYHLMYANRVERSKAKQMGLWNAMCQLVIRWREDDGSHPKYKPPYMTLSDIAAVDKPPSKNLYIKERAA